MKTILLFFCFSVFAASISFAQNRFTDSSATCIAFWKNGETRLLQIKHGKQKYSSSKLQSETVVIYEAHIKIIDSTTDGFTIEWVYKNFKSADSSEESLAGVNTIMEGLKILYKTDDAGSFSELLNWEEVRDFYFNLIEEATARKQDKTATAAINQIRGMFESKESIEAVLIREIQLYHTPYGTEYSLRGETIETELPNISGGVPFPAIITVKLDVLNLKNDFCKVSLNQIIDKGKAGPIIVDLLKRLAGSNSKEADVTNNDIENMEISDSNEFTYSIKSGWLSKIIYKRTATIAAMKQIETYEITESR